MLNSYIITASPHQLVLMRNGVEIETVDFASTNELLANLNNYYHYAVKHYKIDNNFGDKLRVSININVSCSSSVATRATNSVSNTSGVSDTSGVSNTSGVSVDKINTTTENDIKAKELRNGGQRLSNNKEQIKKVEIQTTINSLDIDGREE